MDSSGALFLVLEHATNGLVGAEFRKQAIFNFPKLAGKVVPSASGSWPAAMLVIVSRVYIGTHYASDVLGRAVTGKVADVLVRSLYRQGTPTT